MLTVLQRGRETGVSCAVHISLPHVASNHCMLSLWHVFIEGGERHILPSSSSLVEAAMPGQARPGQTGPGWWWWWLTGRAGQWKIWMEFVLVDWTGPVWTAPIPTFFLYPLPSSSTESSPPAIKGSVFDFPSKPSCSQLCLFINMRLLLSNPLRLHSSAYSKSSLMSSAQHENKHRRAHTCTGTRYVERVGLCKTDKRSWREVTTVTQLYKNAGQSEQIWLYWEGGGA